MGNVLLAIDSTVVAAGFLVVVLPAAGCLVSGLLHHGLLRRKESADTQRIRQRIDALQIEAACRSAGENLRLAA